MVDAYLNDNELVTHDMADARGHAALLLSEGLLHGLIARRILSSSNAIDILDTAVNVQRDRLADLNDQDPIIAWSLALLVDMQGSLNTDLLVIDQGFVRPNAPAGKLARLGRAHASPAQAR